MSKYARMSIDFELGEIIRLYRERAKLSQAAVAKQLGVTAATIANYESGRTPLSYKKVLKFRKVFGDDFTYALRVLQENDGKFMGHIRLKDIQGEVVDRKFERLHKIKKYLEELDKIAPMADIGINIRPAQEDDIDILCENDEHMHYDFMAELIKSGYIYIAESDGKFCGWIRFGMFWNTIPFMNMLYILEDFRGKGYGRFMVEYWEREMLKKGYDRVMVSTQSDEYAQHFYTHIGYKTIGGFMLQNDPYEIIMTKPLM